MSEAPAERTDNTAVPASGRGDRAREVPRKGGVMSKPITGPVLDDLTAQWIDGGIPAERYLKEARQLARESAQRDITKQDHRRSNGASTGNGAPTRPDD